MTIYNLQTALMQEMERLFSDESFLTEGGGYVPMHVYRQSVPLPNGGESVTEYVPNTVVKIRGGTVGQESTADVQLVFLVYDNRSTRNGHDTILHLFSKVLLRFCDNAYLGNFEILKMEYALPDEDFFPYFFGAMEIQIKMPKPSRKDEFC